MRAVKAPDRHLMRDDRAKPFTRKPGVQVEGRRLDLERWLAQLGQIEIDGRIDLHGRTLNEAHAALLHFLHRAQGEGFRTVLVITGKGGPDPERGRGVLRRQVPLWLTLPDLRAYVLAVEEAHIAHGGAGALYVRLRRGR